MLAVRLLEFHPLGEPNRHLGLVVDAGVVDLTARLGAPAGSLLELLNHWPDLSDVEALETAKKQGKARAIGFSSHDRRWIQFMVEYFPQIDVVCFPFCQMSKKAPSHSLFDSLKKCDVGAFGIKPYAAGSLFGNDQATNDQQARLALRYILYTNTGDGDHGVAV